MSESKHGSAGGKARALLQKEEAKQRIDEYNHNPNLCLYCNKPIIAPYDKSLNATKIKKFCNRSCAAKFNNIEKNKNADSVYNDNFKESIIDKYSDEEIIEIFQNSNSIADFSKKLGYKRIGSNKAIKRRLNQIGLDLEKLRIQNDKVLNSTKKELFSQRSSWQNARSTIQKYARIIYKNSNKPKECIVCKYNKHFEVAHIKAVSDFNDDILISKINDIDNLIALCPNHHWEYDNTDFDIAPYLNEVI